MSKNTHLKLKILDLSKNNLTNDVFLNFLNYIY